jgi:carbamate kinase
MKKIAVVALGGNALLKPKDKPSIEVQIKNAQKAAKNIVPLAKRYALVLTHGNGPQVGNILIRTENALSRAYKLPLDVCVAESEGEIGYLLEQALMNEIHALRAKNSVVTILTRTLVDPKDPAFRSPSKPIGPFYSQSRVKIIRKKNMSFIKDSNSGYRRVVPSPRPLKILESPVIRKLLSQKVIVIAAGGGGIPVVDHNNKLKGVEAVVDKDLASSCLAKEICAYYLFIVTDVDCVYTHYGSKNMKKIPKMNVKEAQRLYDEGEFSAGSMGPKIIASIDFLNEGGKKVIITSSGNLQKALIGKAGTIITKR